MATFKAKELTLKKRRSAWEKYAQQLRKSTIGIRGLMLQKTSEFNSKGRVMEYRKLDSSGFFTDRDIDNSPDKPFFKS